MFGHMDNCTDLVDPNNKEEYEKCLREAIKKDVSNMGLPILGQIWNFITSQREKSGMMKRKE